MMPLSRLKKIKFWRIGIETLLISISFECQCQCLIEVPLNFSKKSNGHITFKDYLYTQEDKTGFIIPSSFELPNVFLKKCILNPGKRVYFLYHTGTITKDKFDSLVIAENIDTSFAKKIDNSTLYILGININDSIFKFLPDLNFNKDFSDDSILVIRRGESHVEFKVNLEETEGNQKHLDRYIVGLEVNPDPVKLETNGVREQTSVFLTHSNSYFSYFNFADKKYLIEFFPQFFLAVPKVEDTFFTVSMINENGNPTEKFDSFKRINSLVKVGVYNFQIISLDFLHKKARLSIF